MNIFKRLWIFVFCLNIGKNIDKNLIKNLSDKYSQKILDHAKQSATDALKTTSKRVIRKTAEATDDLIGNKIAERFTRVSRSSPQNNSETIKIEHIKEIPEGRYVSPEERQKIINDLRLTW